jgi:UDP-N-acetylglucosamine--N-acetylmuramyl-(pentapeptide) pyrophosphoryl-undecaprenol N-acetylglucosamine transferase
MAKCVLLAAGGTGGHLFPAFALAQELQRRGHVVDLVTDMRGDRYGTGFPARAVHQIHSATIKGRSPGALAKTGLALMRGVREAFSLLGRLKPAAVVGFGGYPSFPPLVAAQLRRVPSALHEQNAVMGRANRMLAKRVSAIAASFEGTKAIDGVEAKVRVTGNPVREAVIDWSQRAYRAPDASGPIRLVVFGGSQGARFFSETVPAALARLPADIRARIELTEQAREEDVAGVEQALRQAGIRAKVAPFFKDLPQILAESHLVVGRAGASTVAELTVLGRPSMLVPLPHSLDNDQKENATRLAESGGCWCIEQSALTPERLANELEALLRSPERLVAAAGKARAASKPDAVVRLADLVEELMGVRPRASGNR